MMYNRANITDFFMKTLIVLLRILILFLKIGSIIWLYSLMPISRIAIILSYIIVAPSIIWILKKACRSANSNKLYFISLLISTVVMSLLIVLFVNLRAVEFNSEIVNYMSTILFAILIYYVFGKDYNSKIYDVKTIKGSYAYSYSVTSKSYDLYFMKTLIFIFYVFTLVFGQLRDLGIHNSSLFEYEQYAIILIIAIDRVINSFSKEFIKVEDHMKRKKDKEKEDFVKVLSDTFNEKLEEIKEQFELLLRINPEYDIDKLELWDNADDSKHPQTKLLHLYLFFKLLSADQSDKIDELFILAGKSVKNNFNVE